MASDQCAELPHLLQPRLEARHLLREPAGGERPLGEQQHLVEIERLGQVIVGAALHRLDGGLHRPVRGHDDHVRVGRQLAQLGQHGEAVGARHADVEKHEVERRLREHAQRLVAVAHGGDLVAGLTQPFFEHPAQAILVVGDQDPCGIWILGHRAIGRKHVTVVPCPSSLAMWMAPRCCSRIW